MSGFLDAAARTLMLALSAVATLAIIGSIAAIPAGMATQQLGIASERETPVSAAPAAPAEEASNAAGAAVLVEAPPEPPPPTEERWLEVIAYALIAIAGLLAVIALTLMRAVGYLRERSHL